MSLRNRELVNLLVACLLTGIGFTSVYVARQSEISTASLSYAALFLGLYLAAHVVTRLSLPAADPYLLPVIALALPQVAYIARLTRGSMIETLGASYVRTARAKGLAERIVVLRHALKGALLPVVSYLGPATAQVVTGSVVIETIFEIPGIGRYFVQAALNRDYTLVMGTVIVYAVLIIALNLVVDLIYGWLDPKVNRG